jgi:antitoxin MazE
MKATIIKIGNSRGIRIPKPIFEQCGFENEVEMEIHNKELVISSTHKPRDGWAKAFKSMSTHGDDTLILNQVAEDKSTWDEEEWEWNNE